MNEPKKINVLILGSGGREHALAWKIQQSPLINNLYVAPGNTGTNLIAENLEININNYTEVKNAIISHSITILIVGPEKPLVDGIVNYLENFQIKVFGPSKEVSQLEGSKIFTKKICKDFNIPTAKFEIIKNENDGRKFLENTNYPIVVKADNLASGKGVYICENFDESISAIQEIFNGKFGTAKNVLIEEFLKGEEMSFFVISDGITIKQFDTAQDHKRVLEGDKGKNTGGMGAYSPSRLINKKLENKIINKIIKPTINALKKKGFQYKGFLYAGLMIVNDEPYLIEYNVRMGDPECQTILPKLETDLIDIFIKCCDQKLKEISIKWRNKKSLCVVVCSKGYPEKYKKNVEIKNINNIQLNKDEYIFHAGTKIINDKVCAIGGRVLNFVTLSDSFKESRKKIHNNLNFLNWLDGFYRKDIGYKVIDK